MFRTARLAVGALGMAFSALALPALADQFTVTAWAPAGNAAVKITKTDTPTTTYTGSGGGFMMTPTSPAGPSFISWCIDVFQVIPGSTPANYTVNVGASNLSAAVRDGLGRLATLALGTATATGTNSGSYAAAFQLAVWEIFYNTGSSPWSLSSGTFQAISSGTNSLALSTANNWLTFLNANPNSANNYSVNSFISASNQDQITFTNVPEPATLGLMGVGLIGLAFVRRRSSKDLRRAD